VARRADDGCVIGTVSSPGGSLFSTLDTAQAGMRDAERTVDGDAASVATDGPTISSMVDLLVQPSLFRANVRVFAVADAMAGTAVDLLA
jgi:hypothetical protein